MSEVLSRTVGPKGAKKSLRKAFKNQRPIFLWGPPGIGKSDIIKQLGTELDALFHGANCFNKRICNL